VKTPSAASSADVADAGSFAAARARARAKMRRMMTMMTTRRKLQQRR